MEQAVYLDVSMDMPVTVEMSLERVLRLVTGVEALSNVQVNCQETYNFNILKVWLSSEALGNETRALT